MYSFCLLICLSSAYQIIVSDKDGETDLCKSVSTDIKKMERKIDKKLEKMVTTLQQSIDNKCSKFMFTCTSIILFHANHNLFQFKLKDKTCDGGDRIFFLGKS